MNEVVQKIADADWAYEAPTRAAAFVSKVKDINDVESEKRLREARPMDVHI